MNPTQQTKQTIREHSELTEAIERATKTTTVEWQTEDGSWLDRPHANEAAAGEFERKLDKGNINHRRAA